LGARSSESRYDAKMSKLATLSSWPQAREASIRWIRRGSLNAQPELPTVQHDRRYMRAYPRLPHVAVCAGEVVAPVPRLAHPHVVPRVRVTELCLAFRELLLARRRVEVARFLRCGSCSSSTTGGPGREESLQKCWSLNVGAGFRGGFRNFCTIKGKVV